MPHEARGIGAASRHTNWRGPSACRAERLTHDIRCHTPGLQRCRATIGRAESCYPTGATPKCAPLIWPDMVEERGSLRSTA
jgi:hypothetical protein